MVSILAGIPWSFFIMFPAGKVTAVDVDEPGWEVRVKEGIAWS